MLKQLVKINHNDVF